MNRLTCMHCGDTYPDFDVAHVCSKGPYAPKIEPVSTNRIKELEKQCWSHHVDGALVDGQLHFDTQKFAELIVQECGVALSPMLRDMVSRGQAFDLIKQHFGVEE